MKSMVRVLLVLSGCALGHQQAIAAPINYLEAVSGDLGTAFPLTQFTLDAGLNLVSGQTLHDPATGAGDFDSFAIVVPSGFELVGVQYAFTLFPSTGNTVANLGFETWVGNVFGPPALLPMQIVDLYGASPVAMFAAALPLGPNTYSIWNRQLGPTTTCCGWTAAYTWTFDVRATETVPEPGSMILLGSGLVALAARRRRARRQ